MNSKIALRMDDVGASSKKFEIYGKESVRLFGKAIPIYYITNFLFIKYLPGITRWGSYEELTSEEIEKIYIILRKYNAKLTVAITATWIDKNGESIPFPEKFPKQAKTWKNGLNEGIIEIANHGFSHCVIGKHLPKLFLPNRKYHREFWDWLPYEIHKEHIEKSQEILTDYFGIIPNVLVPPGNVFSSHTVECALNNGLNIINCSKNSMSKLADKKIKFISNDNVIDFHDREIVKYGVSWFENKLIDLKKDKKVFVSEL